MENIFEIALESAYGNWNEPLLEADHTSVKDRVIAAVKKFYERLKEFFKKMLARIKSVFNGNKDQSSSSGGNSDFEVTGEKDKADKEAVDKLRKDITNLNDKIKQVRKEINNLAFKQVDDADEVSNAKHREKAAKQKLEDYKFLFEDTKDNINSYEKRLKNVKERVKQIDNIEEDTKKFESTINEKASKIPCSASDALDYISKLASNIDKAYSIMMNTKDPAEEAEQLKELANESKIPDNTLKPSQILDVPYDKFKSKSREILPKLWDTSKLEQVQNTLVKKIQTAEKPEIYNNMNGSLSHLINIASKFSNIVESIQGLYIFNSKNNPKYRIDTPADRDRLVKEIEDLEESIVESRKILKETEQDLKNAEEEIAKHKATQVNKANDEAKHAEEQKAKEKELDELNKERDEKKQKLKDKYGIEESVDVFCFNL